MLSTAFTKLPPKARMALRILGILSPSLLAVAALVSAVEGAWLPATCLFTATAMATQLVVMAWPFARTILKGILVLALIIAAVVVLAHMGAEASWLLGAIVVIFGVAFICAVRKQRGMRVRPNRR